MGVKIEVDKKNTIFKHKEGKIFMTKMEILETYLNALPAEQYDIRLIHATNKANFLPIKRTWTRQEVLNNLKFLQAKNASGYNVYGRPLSYEYILLDDLKREVLSHLAQIKPCLLMETSPQNFQAFVHLSFVPASREIAFQICRELCHLFDADEASAEPDHIGRLPGFTNRKPKYQGEKGDFPPVKLHRAENRLSNYQFIPKLPKLIDLEQTTSVSNSLAKPREVVEQTNAYDQSRADFNLACMLIRQNKTDEYIYERIKAQFNADKHKESDYIPRTIRNARQAVAKQANK